MVGAYRKRAARRVLIARGFTKDEARAILTYAKSTRLQFMQRGVQVRYEFDSLASMLQSFDTWIITTP